MNKQIKKRTKKGFTLIELVVVIAILGILAAILIPVISGFINRANEATDLANARTLYSAGAMYFSTANLAAGDDVDLTAAQIKDFTGLDDFPAGRYYTGSFGVNVKGDGTITVTLGTLVYDPTTASFS